MKKIFIAISFLMAILLIPLIYETVDNVMSEKNSISFVLTDVDTDTGEGNVTIGTYDKLIPYVKSSLHYIETGEALEITLFVDNIIVDGDFIIYIVPDSNIYLANLDIVWDDPVVTLSTDDTFYAPYSHVFPVQENMNIRIEFETSSTSLWSILLSLMPLVFVGGLIVYFVKKNGLSD